MLPETATIIKDFRPQYAIILYVTSGSLFVLNGEEIYLIEKYDPEVAYQLRDVGHSERIVLEFYKVVNEQVSLVNYIGLSKYG